MLMFIVLYFEYYFVYDCGYWVCFFVLFYGCWGVLGEFY